jgi:hypothetical protein
MNVANAFGFLTIGLTMWLLPLLAPGWFPHTAVDGSSTRALWTQIMGLVQFGLGAGFLARSLATPFAQWSAAIRRGAVATADWQTDAAPAPSLAVDLQPALAVGATHAPFSAGSVTLHGEHAALWRTLHAALPKDQHRVAQFSQRVRSLLRERGHGPHPIAAAMFRRHPQTSFLHLVGPHVAAFKAAPADQTSPEQKIITLLREEQQTA